MNEDPRIITHEFGYSIVQKLTERRMEDGTMQDREIVPCADGYRFSQKAWHELNQDYNKYFNHLKDFNMELNYKPVLRQNTTNNNNNNNSHKVVYQKIKVKGRKSRKRKKRTEKLITIKASLKTEFNSGNYVVDFGEALAYCLMGDKYRKGRNKLPIWVSLEDWFKTLIDGGYKFID